MEKWMKTFFLFNLFAVYYIYIGYLVVLLLISFFVRIRACCIKKFIMNNIWVSTNNKFPNISVIIAAYNEEKNIQERIENLMILNYQKENLEILVGSDGSTDKTGNIVRRYVNLLNNLNFLEFEREGKAITHNKTIQYTNGDIIVFTDADTKFDKDFLKEIVKYFYDEKTGCVIGNLIYKTKGTAVSESEGFYWKFEKRVRQLESNLGILATATGACMAVRKTLWRDLTPIDDSDFTTPLDVILQGYRVVYAPDAIAYDIPPSSVKGELKARIRQTSKNLIGTLKRWGWHGWLKHPFVSWGLLSHKILRWFTPFFMLGAFISNSFLLDKGDIYQVTFVIQLAFYIAVFMGLIGEILMKKIPIASTIFSFFVANVGMGIGVIKGFIGKAPASYKTRE